MISRAQVHRERTIYIQLVICMYIVHIYTTQIN